MTQAGAEISGHGGQRQMRDGDDFVCPNCGCEIMLKHHGDPQKMGQMAPFTCCCGTPMEFEHAAGETSGVA
jgi:hypothetical protein